jgi:hypothetical protein
MAIDYAIEARLREIEIHHGRDHYRYCNTCQREIAAMRARISGPRREVDPNVRAVVGFAHALRNTDTIHWDFWARRFEDRVKFLAVVQRITGLYLEVCSDCGSVVRYLWADSDYCEPCYQDHYEYCETCDEWFDRDECHSHPQGSLCDVQGTKFDFYGHTNDTSFDYTVPGGEITSTGWNRIIDTLYQSLPVNWGFESGLEQVDRLWTTPQGNFTKRLAKLALQNNLKISPQLLSEVGNIAREYSSQPATLKLEFSREFNESARHWYHEDSCYWGQYAASRCQLKNHGTIGLRTYDSYGDVNGRAWLQPIAPTTGGWVASDKTDSDAFVLFNVYGHEYVTIARILATMTGKSYTRVSFSMSDTYINSSGWLIASPETCQKWSSIILNCEQLCDCVGGGWSR